MTPPEDPSTLFEVVTGRWTLQLLVRLSYGPRRFSDLKNELEGISPNLLTKRLRSLEDDEIIRRVVGAHSARLYELAYGARPLDPILRAARNLLESYS